LEDRRNVGGSSCNSGDGTDQRVQSLMFMMTMKNTVYNTRGTVYICDDVLLNSSQNETISDESCTEKTKTHILCSVTLVSRKSRRL
jgi:hypothetical protein